MKQLTCEMCGSTDLLKQDGVFVCQSCACKYSVEEAKKMMIEGIVAVQGTVKIDDTDKIQNYLNLSNNSYESGNGQLAFDYANKALEIDSKNSRVWIAKMKSIELIATMGDARLNEFIEAGKNAINYTDEDKSDIKYEVYTYQIKRALELLNIITVNLYDTAEIKKTLETFMSISMFSGFQNTRDIDQAKVLMYSNIVSEAVNMVHFVPDNALLEFPELAQLVDTCAKQYQHVTDALVLRYKIYGTTLADSAIKARNEIRKSLEDKANLALTAYEEMSSIEKAKRYDDYWEKHYDEKIKLESDKATAVETKKILIKKKENVPGINDAKDLEKRFADLTKEQEKLGLFKGKERQIKQKEMNSVKAKINAIDPKIAAAVLEIQKQIDIAEKVISSVDEEFAKYR